MSKKIDSLNFSLPICITILASLTCGLFLFIFKLRILAYILFAIGGVTLLVLIIILIIENYQDEKAYKDSFKKKK